MRKLFMWSIVFITASAALGLLYFGIDKLSPSKDKASQNTVAFKTSVPFNIAIIGDSVAKGTGDEKGSGFSTYVPEYLKDSISGNIYVYNGGIDGLTSSGLLELLKSGKLDNQISDSDLIVLSIGGNDVLKVNSVNDGENLGALKDIQGEYMDNLRDILNSIRGKNSNALIAFAGLYNPREDMSSPLYSSLLNMWNNSTQSLLEEYRGTDFVKTDDLFKNDLKRFISPDKLHPNSAGYQAISENIARLIDQM